MSWQFNRTEAVFVQIANRLRQEILCGTYPPGTQIPPVRQIALDASVNPNTVQKALTALENEGLLYAQGTVGRFVTSDTAVLDTAREKAKQDAIRSLVSEATALGITKQELFEYFEKEEAKNEHTDPCVQEFAEEL